MDYFKESISIIIQDRGDCMYQKNDTKKREENLRAETRLDKSSTQLIKIGIIHFVVASAAIFSTVRAAEHPPIISDVKKFSIAHIKLYMSCKTVNELPTLIAYAI